MLEKSQWKNWSRKTLKALKIINFAMHGYFR